MDRFVATAEELVRALVLRQVPAGTAAAEGAVRPRLSSDETRPQHRACYVLPMTSPPHEVDLAGPRPSSGRPARAWDWMRLVVAALIMAAVVATVAEAAGRTSINPFNLFGYFTIQSNILLAVVLTLVGARGVAGRGRSAWAQTARAACLTYIVLVGLVYAVLLAPLGAAGGVPVPWANVVLHVVTPLYAVIDWVLAPERRALPARTVGVILIYPVVWLVVVLVRGATDGWVPYPFLDPANGYGQVALTVTGIALVVLVAGWVVVLSSRRLARRSHRANS